jgi:hypothetical protein
MNKETPPRARGRHLTNYRHPPFSRNTPACAGKTFSWCWPTKAKEKHPRVRGEDALIARCCWIA